MVLESLVIELERPRELSARVVNYLRGTYDLDFDGIGPFLVQELPKLEDYEIDLILSPVFTPKLSDQAVFAELLGSDSVPPAQWPALIQQLVARPTRAQLVTSDGQPHTVTLREVTIERYVHRLRLEAAIPESLLKLIDRISSGAERPTLRAIARRPIWENDVRREILEQYLTAAADRNSYSLADALELLNLIENYKPDDVPDLLARIPRRQEALRAEIDASGSKPFFSAAVQNMHGGGRDQRRQDDVRISAKEKELAFLGKLQEMLVG